MYADQSTAWLLAIIVRTPQLCLLTVVAFITAGLLTSLGRKFRHLVRPYFVSPTASSPNSLPKYPYPNATKRVYDIVGWFLVQANLNYVAGAFMLLSFGDCIKAWKRTGFYGHVLIAVASLFFKVARPYLRKGIRKDDKPLPAVSISPPSPPEDETNPKDLRWVKHALDNPGYQDSGAGVHPDGGIVDKWMDGAETPLTEKTGFKLKEL